MHIRIVLLNQKLYFDFERKKKKESVILQEGETCDYKWADKEEILAMGDDELLAQTMRKYVI